MQGKNGSLSLSKESPLMMCGYTVRESDGLTSKERQLILANIIDRKILSKPRVIDYLQFFVSWRDGNPNMRNACDKWREDLTFVRNYKMDTQRRFSIRSVQRYR
jgi:exoribonuclease II